MWVFKIMCVLMWVFCEWANEIKVRKFVPQHPPYIWHLQSPMQMLLESGMPKKFYFRP